MIVTLICRSSIWWLWKRLYLLNPSTLEMRKSRFLLTSFYLSTEGKSQGSYIFFIIKSVPASASDCYLPISS
jgi:hypothetical protein